MIPKIMPIMQAKKRPSSARSNVLPMAARSIPPYTVIILIILKPF
jgi:hypothetical protein